MGQQLQTMANAAIGADGIVAVEAGRRHGRVLSSGVARGARAIGLILAAVRAQLARPASPLSAMALSNFSLRN